MEYPKYTYKSRLLKKPEAREERLPKPEGDMEYCAITAKQMIYLLEVRGFTLESVAEAYGFTQRLIHKFVKQFKTDNKVPRNKEELNEQLKTVEEVPAEQEEVDEEEPVEEAEEASEDIEGKWREQEGEEFVVPDNSEITLSQEPAEANVDEVE